MNRSKIQSLPGRILDAPLLVWILLGFSISYLFFFLRPVFFSDQVMKFFRYIPALNTIGKDLKQMLDFSASIAGHPPYIVNLYPPLASLLFTPLLLASFSWAYRIFSLITVFCYAAMTFVFPLQVNREKQVSSLIMFVFITGLFSYGFQFELERGQWNVVAVFLSFLAIWIYHYHHKQRYLAYILFTISVQLKVFPLIFIVMLVDNWRDWGNNIKRSVVFAAVNFALFLVLGPKVFVDWVKALTTVSGEPYVWVGNHSTRSFVEFASTTAADHGWAWVNQYAGSAQPVLLALIGICIFLVVLKAYLQNQKGINPHLLLACTLGALLIPSVSHDYKLSILAAPVALLFSSNKFQEEIKGYPLRTISILLLLILSVAYSSTLVSYTNKPLIIQNNFPALVIMLMTVTFLYWMSKPAIEEKTTASTESPEI